MLVRVARGGDSNYLAQEAIEAAEAGGEKNYAAVKTLLTQLLK